MKFDVNFTLNFTVSKIMAFIVLLLATIIDLVSHANGSVFSLSLPVVVILITGKQYFDYRQGK
ncbi:MAG: hypothetical protein GX459_03160 [Bacteroidales bacterium]|nr:hypothetical protein [Bacteroidales bacterium]